MTQVAEQPTQEISLPEQKKEAWIKLATSVHVSELQLQARASAAINEITKPVNFEFVPEAEAKLKKLKQIKAEIEADRKVITTKLDGLSTRLMQPEKSLEEPIKNLTADIIAVKKRKEEADRLVQQKHEEVKRIVESVKNLIASSDYEFKSQIGIKVSLAYEHALGTDIKPEKLEEYLNKIKAKVGAADFQVNKPEISEFNAKCVGPVEVQSLIEANFNTNPHAYVAIFQEELAEKFVDYATAYQNKADALALSVKQQAEKEAALKAEQENKAIAAKLEASSTEVTVNTGVKALKKSYEVDMVESMENAFLILSAFLANRDKCASKTSTKKWFSFGADSAAKALAKVKSDDNSFNPQGIIWKEVDKL